VTARGTAAAAELDALLRRMCLPYLRKAAPDVRATARAQRREAGQAGTRQVGHAV
jgi:hypothetical protein